MSGGTVYAIASGKGGVGKTTTTVNLGTAMAARDQEVALVDADLGMANLGGFVGLSTVSPTLHEVLADRAPIEDAMYPLDDGVVAVPGGSDLTAYADTSVEALGAVVDTLRERVDVTILDVGAGVSHESVLPLGLADGVILLSTPEPASVRDARKTIELTERAGGAVTGLLVTLVRSDSDVDASDIADTLGIRLLGVVPEDPAVRESMYASTPLVTHRPDSPAAESYRRLAGELCDGDGDTAGNATSPEEVSRTVGEVESDGG